MTTNDTADEQVAGLKEAADLVDDYDRAHRRQRDAITAWHEGGVEQRAREEARNVRYEAMNREQHDASMREREHIQHHRDRAEERDIERIKLVKQELDALSRIATALETIAGGKAR